jgi:hypothetical protein
MSILAMMNAESPVLSDIHGATAIEPDSHQLNRCCDALASFTDLEAPSKYRQTSASLTKTSASLTAKNVRAQGRFHDADNGNKAVAVDVADAD